MSRPDLTTQSPDGRARLLLMVPVPPHTVPCRRAFRAALADKDAAALCRQSQLLDSMDAAARRRRAAAWWQLAATVAVCGSAVVLILMLMLLTSPS